MARYIDLDKLIVKARAIDPPHNFQHERRDIVEYIYASWNHLLKAFYNDDVGAAGFDIIDTVRRESILLKPCPICGGSASIIKDRQNRNEVTYIECVECGQRTAGYGIGSISEIVSIWNQRCPEDVHPDA